MNDYSTAGDLFYICYETNFYKLLPAIAISEIDRKLGKQSMQYIY